MRRVAGDLGEHARLDPAAGQIASRVGEYLLLPKSLAWRLHPGAHAGLVHDVDDGHAVAGTGKIGSMLECPPRSRGAVVRHKHVSHDSEHRLSLGELSSHGLDYSRSGRQTAGLGWASHCSPA
jgi:hypothetical protein